MEISFHVNMLTFNLSLLFFTKGIKLRLKRERNNSDIKPEIFDFQNDNYYKLFPFPEKDPKSKEIKL